MNIRDDSQEDLKTNKQDELKSENNSEKVTDETESLDEDITKYKTQYEAKEQETKEYYEALQRVMAEFDNYKKRTRKEKDETYSNAATDVLTAFLPVLDNLERSITSNQENTNALQEGITLVCKQFRDVLKSFGVEEIKTIGENFDPNLHNAVMHVQDENYSEGQIIEELRKGYTMGDKVIRHSMVKVAN